MKSWTLRSVVNPRLGVALAACAGLLVAVGLGAAAMVSRGETAYASIPRPLPAVKGAVLTTSALLTPPSAAPELSPLPSVVAVQDLTPEQALAANKAIPVSTLPNPAAKPFVMRDVADEDRTRAETCLTQAVYYEAGFEPLAGEQAVAQVVLNRVRHPIFPKTVCGVVFQGSQLKTGCQFTFTCDGSLAKPPEDKAWKRAQAVAEAALSGFVMKSVGEATHYHTQYVVPYWSPTLVKLTQIGAHIFYRWTGTSGQPPAFAGHYAGNEPGADLQVAALVPLTPVQALAAQPSGDAATASAGDEASKRGDADGKPNAAAAPAPVVIARIDPPPAVQADTPQVGPVKKTFIQADSWVPRPKFRPF